MGLKKTNKTNKTNKKTVVSIDFSIQGRRENQSNMSEITDLLKLRLRETLNKAFQ